MIKETLSVLSIDLFNWLNRRSYKLILILALASWLAVLNFPDNKVKIVYCDAGQGDETLIQRGFTQIIIDGSRPGRALDCLRKHIPFFDRQIELMIVSHPQLDHFGGLTDVVKRYKVMSFVYNGIKGDSREWEEFSKLVLAEKAKIEVVVAGDEIKAGGMKLKVLWPEKETIINHPQSNVLGVSSPGELNSGAVVADFNYGEFDALFTGDIGEEEEKQIINKGYNNYKFYKNYQVLKVAHHGSKYSSSLDFLKAIRPALAVIEVGKNSYGHPTAETLERLKEVGAKILRTDLDGDVVISTDGKNWKVLENSNLKAQISKLSSKLKSIRVFSF